MNQLTNQPINYLYQMIFVTGGTGLLGAHILIELSRRGNDIRALKRPSSNLDMVRRVFVHYLGEEGNQHFDKIEWVDGDLLDILSLRDGIQGCDVVYHAAATVSFIKRDFRKLMQVNKEGTANVVNTCLEMGVDHLCYVSSTSAIGQTEGKEIFDESDKWFRSPLNSNYSVSKFSAEMEVWRGVEEGLDAVIVNPSVIFGAGDWKESSISIFRVMKRGLKFFTPGGNAFVDARDVAFLLAEMSEKRVFNERFLAVSENLLFKDVFERIAKAFNVKPPSIRTTKFMAALAWRWESFLRFFFGRKQNISKETARSAMKITKFSNAKIRERMNFEFIPIDDSIENAVAFFEKNKLT